MKYFYLKYSIVFFLNLTSSIIYAQPSKKEKFQNIDLSNQNKSVSGDQRKHNFDSLEINGFFKNYPQLKIVQQDVSNFYQSRNFSYAWYSEGRLIEQAGNLYNRVTNLQDEGIYQKIPYRDKLEYLLQQSKSKHNINPNISLELMLTAQYFMFSKLSWEGMDQSVSESLKWYLPRKKVNYEQYLDSLIGNNDPKELPKEPVYRQYNLLKAFLKKYRDLDRLDSWPKLQYARVERKGDSTLLIAQIKKRLFLLGDYSGDTTNIQFDNSFYKAVIQFQQRNGLTIDGKIGMETINTLNIPLKSRIKQILVNMERNRWLPIASHEDILAINIPDFKLHVFHADSLLWSCNVVVGQTIHPTTVFYGDLKFVVFSPYWYVPESIVKHEIFPQMSRNAEYLADHYMEIRGYRNGLPILRQKPGRNNSLGLVKFLFPNSYNIYLHDTPSKSLFGESSRTFSHGCIRVEEPVKLANFLLRFQPEWTPEKINLAMNNGKEISVKLKNTIPVFIVYFTSFVDQNHRLNFRKDIYHLDDPLAHMLLQTQNQQ